jgi:uncharacterized repeat protein (TIGR01451 family)
VLELQAPANLSGSSRQSLEIVAQSSRNPAVRETLAVAVKTPGQLLLVDDDRFFEIQQAYTSTLESLGLEYDVWKTGWAGDGLGSPRPELLAAYPLILWYTGYDWFAPVTPEENAGLHAYLQQGGRLFLSSQDYLFYNWHSPLTGDHLGLFDYQETITPTLVFGGESSGRHPSLTGPVDLDYGPYQNFSDGLVLRPGSQPFFWTDQGMPAGLARAAPTSEGGQSRLVFFSFPFETLSGEARLIAMRQIIGWLASPVAVAFSAAKRIAVPGEPQTYTIALQRGVGAGSHTVAITNTLPPGLDLLEGSLSPPADFHSANRQITWRGDIQPGETVIVRYEAVADASLQPGTRLDNQLSVGPGHQGIENRLTASTWFMAPDLSSSELHVESRSSQGNQWITYTLRLLNVGPTAAGLVTATLPLPKGMQTLTDTLHHTAGEVSLDFSRLLWTGSMQPEQVVSASIALTRPLALDGWVSTAAILEDGIGDPLVLPGVYFLPPYRSFFPLFAAR